MIDTVQVITDEGKKAGFTATEVFGERIHREEFDYFPGQKTLRHQVNTHRVTARVFWETGDPVGFRLSSPGEQDVKSAFLSVYSGDVPTQKKNYARRLPASVQRVNVRIYDENIEKVDEQRFEEMADQLHEIILSPTFKELRLKRVHFSKTLKKIYIANTNGLNAKYIKSRFHLLLSVGMGRSSIDISDNSTFYDQLEPMKLVSRSYNLLNTLTENLLDERHRHMPLVLAPEASAFILKEFSENFKEQTDKKLEELAFPSMLNLVDDPSMDGQPGSAPFDDEGVQSTEKHLIRKGMFMGGIADIGTGSRYGIRSTGNGFRSLREMFPAPRFSNLYIKPTVLSMKNLMEDAGEGVLVSLVKLKYVDREGHLFSAYGYRFSGSHLLEPVHFYFRTTFLSYFLNIRKVSKGVKFFFSNANIGSPYILLEVKRKSPGIWGT